MPTIFETLTALPPTLRVSVDYYDAVHRALLTAAPYPPQVRAIAGTTIDIPSADLLGYYLFWKQRARPDLYSNLKNVRSIRLEEAAGELANLITFRGGSIHGEADVKEFPISVTGRLGEAVGLCVLNQIHNLTSLDWIALPEKKEQLPAGLKPMDYQNSFGSNGAKAVQVECKGTFLLGGDLRVKPPKIVKHATNIAVKKKTLDKLPTNLPRIWKADVRYGTITTFGKVRDGDAHCWLLDPPASGGGASEEAQSIARLLNVTYWLRMIAPRSPVTVALVNRMAAIAASESAREFQDFPLTRGSGVSFEDMFETVTAIGSCSSRFFSQRSKVDGYPAGGTVFPLRDGGFMFVGVREDLLALAVRQDFEGLRRYKSRPSVFESPVHAVFPRDQAEKLDLDETDTYAEGYYFHSELQGRLFSTSGGLVLGFLDRA